MKIAFLHYHLKTGGVTTVIRQQLEALKNSCELLLITGEPTRQSFPATILSIPEIAYDNPAQTPADPFQTAKPIKKAIYSHWPIYNSLDIPLHTLNVEIFFKKMRNCILVNSNKFNLNMTNSSIKAAFEKITNNNRVDFGI